MTLQQGETVEAPGADSYAATNDREIHGFLMRVRGGPHDGRLIRVASDKCTIGRSENCTVRLVADGFAPLHCLMARGQGGVVVRRWSENTTLNGQEFSVSWMVPGDRLGVGPIELEMLSDEACSQPLPGKELTNDQQLLEQLLAERQELLEQLGSLQATLDGRASEQQRRESELVRGFEARTEHLEQELQRLRAERDLTQSVLNELREEVEDLMQLHEAWRCERQELERRLEQASLESASNPRMTPTPTRDDNVESETSEDGDRPDSSTDESERPWYLSRSEPREDTSANGISEHELRSMLNDSCENVVAEQGKYSALSAKILDSSPELNIDDEAPGAFVRVSDPTRFTDNSMAPETTDDNTEMQPILIRRASGPRIDLSAMRDVANHTAHVAIDQHAHRCGLQLAMHKWTIGICASTIGCMLTQLTTSNQVFFRVISAVCWVTAAWWFLLGALAYRNAALKNPHRLQQAAGEASPTEPD